MVAKNPFIKNENYFDFFKIKYLRVFRVTKFQVKVKILKWEVRQFKI